MCGDQSAMYDGTRSPSSGETHAPPVACADADNAQGAFLSTTGRVYVGGVISLISSGLTKTHKYNP